MKLPGSIKSRITLLVLVAVIGGWLVAAVLTVRAAQHEAEEVFDGHLVQAAAMLLAQSTPPSDGDDDDAEDAAEEEAHVRSLHKYARRVIFQVWRGGRLTLHSAHAPNTPLSRDREGFSEVSLDAARWRIYSVADRQRDLLVQVGEDLHARDEVSEEIIKGQLWPLLAGLPVLALLVWLAVRHGIAPLDRLGAELERRDAQQLQPIALDDLADELRPVVARLNALFARVDAALAQERRFTADAAHELRTPLAGLRAQAQVAQAATDDTSRGAALSALLSGVDRMTRLVEQMLTLARADQATLRDAPLVDLHALACRAVADCVEAEPSVHVRGIDLGVVGTAVRLPGEASWLAILLRNLIDNAVRHAPDVGQVAVSVHAEADAVLLSVEDSGAGLPAATRARLGERFFRDLDGHDGRAPGVGSGLGLSIVARIAQLHGGTLAFADSPLGGLKVLVRLPVGAPNSPAPAIVETPRSA